MYPEEKLPKLLHLVIKRSFNFAESQINFFSPVTIVVLRFPAWANSTELYWESDKRLMLSFHSLIIPGKNYPLTCSTPKIAT